jgi:putative endonuclease
MDEWVVYILRCADDTLYTGITNDLPSRINAHSEGKGAKYTKGRGPFTLVYQEPCATRSAASKRERAIKQMSRAQKQAL